MFLKLIGHLNDLLRNAFRILIVFLSSSFITELYRTVFSLHVDPNSHNGLWMWIFLSFCIQMNLE